MKKTLMNENGFTFSELMLLLCIFVIILSLSNKIRNNNKITQYVTDEYGTEYECKCIDEVEYLKYKSSFMFPHMKTNGKPYTCE